MLDCYVDIVKVSFVVNRCLKQIINFHNYKSKHGEILYIYVSLLVGCLCFLFSFNQNRNGSEYFSKYSKYKAHGNLSGRSCRQADGRTDMTRLRVAFRN